MALGILQNGIAERTDDGTATLYRPDRNGGRGSEIEVPKDLARAVRIETGDIVEGETEPIPDPDSGPAMRPGQMEDGIPAVGAAPDPRAPTAPAPLWLPPRLSACERLVRVTRINGLPTEEAGERPAPRKRGSYER